jgi:toxin FitB
VSWLLDTCFVSEPRRKRPDEGVLEFLDREDGAAMYLSVLTVGEIEKGVELLPDAARRRATRAWLAELERAFEGRVLALDAAVSKCWGQMTGKLQRQGIRLPAVDSLIAATALQHGLTIVTRNVADMEPSGARVHNPWRG